MTRVLTRSLASFLAFLLAAPASAVNLKGSRANLSIASLHGGGFQVGLPSGALIPAPRIAPGGVTIPQAVAGRIELPAQSESAPTPLETVAEGAALEIEAIRAPDATDAGSAQAAEQLSQRLQGGVLRGSDGAVEASYGAPGSLYKKLSAPGLSGGGGSRAGTPAPSAGPVIAPESVVEGGFRYFLKRARLVRLAKKTGVVASLPVMGPKLTKSVLAELHEKDFIFTDIDDTLAPHNQPPSPEMIELLLAVKKAGKTIVFITDRPDAPEEFSAFRTLKALPLELRAGTYVGTNGGGRVYKYDAAGEPKLESTMTSLQELGHDKKVLAARDALKARLKDLKAVQHDGTGGQVAEDLLPHSFAFMLQVGTPEDTTKAVGKAFREELAKQGLPYGVIVRGAPKNPAHAPYIVMNMTDKSTNADWIAGKLGASQFNTVILGDSMYNPSWGPSEEVQASPEAIALAEKLSGRPMPKSGNETDRNMGRAKRLKGALMLSVGLTGDPREPRLYVMPGKFATETPRILRAAAAGPSAWARVGAAVILLLFIAGGIFGWGMIAYMFASVASLGNDALQYYPYTDPFLGW